MPAEELPADAVRAAFARGRAAFPDLPLDEPAFASHLGRIVSAGGGAKSMPALEIEDLFLACACATGVPGAASVFAVRHGTTLRAAVARIVRDEDAKEIEQRLSHDLLVGSVTAPPKLASYAGRSPLERWIGVVAQREALLWLRENRAEARARDAAAAEPSPGGNIHPEVAFLKERYRSDFERAVREALERVADQDRVLLRLHIVNGLTVEAIGKMYGFSQATASRRLAAAREALLADVKTTLAGRLGTKSEEIASLAGLVASRLDVSLSALLRTR